MIPASGDGHFLTGSEDLIGNSYGFDFISFTYPIRIGNFKIVPQVSYQRAISYDLEFTMNDVYSITEEYIPELDAQVDFQGSFTEKQKFIGGVGIKRGGFGVDLPLLYESGSYLRDNIDYSVTRFAEVRVNLSTNYSF